MAAVPQPSEHVRELLQNLKVDPKTQSGDRKETAPIQEGNHLNNIGNASLVAGRAPMPSSTSLPQSVSDAGVYYAANGYVMPHGFVYEYGHGGEWEESARYVGVEGLELHSPIYGENGSLIFHPAGFNFSSHPPYAPFSPGPPMPTMGPDGQLYGPSAFQYPGPLYPQSVPSGAQFITAASGAVTTELPISGSREPGLPSLDSGIVAGNNLMSGQRPVVPLGPIPPHGPYPRGVLPVALHNSMPQDVRLPYDGLWGLRSNAPSRSDATKNLDRRKSSTPSASASVQSTTAQNFSIGPSQSIRPAPPMQLHVSTHPSQNAPPAVVSSNLRPAASGRSYTPVARVIPSLNGFGRANRTLGINTVDSRANVRTWIGVDKSKQRGRGLLPLYASSQNLDILNEQNRGPRTTRMRSPRPMPGVLKAMQEPGASSVGVNDVLNLTSKDQYNQSDFQTDYETARFFVIKSYSEDDIHKSIKYHVWASTPNGNKRLEAAYQDAQTKSASASKTGRCPLFLFFSVNASGQFCGVAEMTGPVDFSKSMDFWQQDKWSGRIPVKWHIVKDVPNSHFRHIILEVNDNKPVTNSRDTQEVKFDQGIEMLKIFKNYAARTSILDDFHFYEARERVLQARRGRPQSQLQHARIVYQTVSGGEESQVTEPSNLSRKPNDGAVHSHNFASSASTEPLPKSLMAVHSESHSAPLLSAPLQVPGEGAAKKDNETHEDSLASAVANMHIQQKDDIVLAVKSES